MKYSNKFKLSKDQKIENIDLIDKNIKLEFYKKFCVNVIDQLKDNLDFNINIYEEIDSINKDGTVIISKMLEYSIELPNIRKKILADKTKHRKTMNQGIIKGDETINGTW